MDATLARALNDPAGFMASKIGQRRFATQAAPDRAAEQPSQPSSSAASIDSWAQAFANASGQRPPPPVAEGSVDGWAEVFARASGMPRK